MAGRTTHRRRHSLSRVRRPGKFFAPTFAVSVGLVLGTALLSALLVLLPTSSAQATTAWQITRLTNNSVSDVAEDLAEGFAIWSHWDGHDSELYLRMILAGLDKQITDNETNDSGAKLDGGRLAWRNTPLSGAAVDYAQIMLMAPPDGTPFALTAADYVRQISDNQAGNICWYGRPTATGPMQAFYYYVGTGVTTRVTDAAVNGQNPSSDGRWVAYTRWWVSPGTPPMSRIALYDLGTGTTRELNPNLNWREESFKLYGAGTLLYQSHDGHDWEVWAADLLANTRRQISSDDLDDWPVGLSYNTLVAWYEVKPGVTDDHPTQYRIHLYDLALGAEVWVSNYVYSLGTPEFNGALLVWSAAETADADKEIWVFDCESGAVTQLTDNEYDDDGAYTDGHRVLWTGEAGTAPAGEYWNTREVFLALPYDWPPATAFFLDVPTDHPYFEAIEGLHLAGVIGGYETSGGWEFRPAASAYRAQFAKMICETLGLQVPPNLACPFSDLGADDPNNLYPHQYVAMAAAKGITSGTGQNQFSPYTNIVRAQVVTMIVRAADSLAPGALHTPLGNYVGTLGDFSPAHAETMRKAEYNGLLNGLESFGKTWDPWAPATRGEIAAMLWALKGLL